MLCSYLGKKEKEEKKKKKKKKKKKERESVRKCDGSMFVNK